MANWTKVGEVPRHFRLLRMIVRHWPGQPSIVINATIRGGIDVQPNSIIADNRFIPSPQKS